MDVQQFRPYQPHIRVKLDVDRYAQLLEFVRKVASLDLPSRPTGKWDIADAMQDCGRLVREAKALLEASDAGVV